MFRSIAGKCLVAWAVLAILCGFSPQTRAVDPLRLGDVWQAMRHPSVSVTVTWRDCGEVNGYYYPEKREIVMCNELVGAVSPGFIRFIFAHEMAHAVITQLNVPFTGHHEAAADELAGVMMALYGMKDDLIEASMYWIKRGANMPPWVDHPDDDQRGFDLMCIAHGSTLQGGCVADWLHKRDAWMRLLGYQ